jgi:gliding motility-associated-like protein
MKRFYLLGLFTALVLLAAQKADAQLDSCNVFLQGNYIEVGINWNGAYGSSAMAPTGYHPKGPAGEINAASCGALCISNGANLGFVADPDKDGWTVGSPYPYYGDYFLPGTPQEGWSIMADGTQANAWNQSGCGTTFPAGMTGSNISYSAAGKTRTGIWRGTYDSLAITQTTTLDTNNVYFTVYITVINKSHNVKHDIYYLRTLDPDNAEPETGNFTTYNKIEYQLPNPQNRTLVSAVGLTATNAQIASAFLGLGTLDCRARCFIIDAGLSPTSGTLDSMYGKYEGKGDTANYQYSGSNTQDQGIGLVFRLGDLNAADSLTFAYAYILRKGDLDSAFLSTKPKWTDFGDTAAFKSGDTASVCKNSIIPVSILNGGYLSWSWTSPTGNSIYPSYGTAVNVSIDTTPAVLRAVGSTAACQSDTLYITLHPNLAVNPIVKSPIYYCIGGTPQPLQATGKNLRWYTSLTGDTGTTTAPTPRTDSVATYLYYVSSTIRGCESDKVPVQVVVNLPPPKLVAGNGGMACLGENAQLTATTINSSHYYWSGPNGFKSNDQNAVVNNVVAADSGMYIVIDSLYGCPTQIDSTLLWVNNLFSKVKTGKPSVCIGDTLVVDFAGAAPGNDSSLFQWNFAGGTIIKGDPTGKSRGPYVVQWDTAGNKYIVLISKNLRCVSKAIDTLPVAFAPQVAFSMPKDICINDTVTLHVADYSLTNASKFMWTYGGGREVSNGTTSSGIDYMTFNSIGTKIVTLSIAYPQCIRSPFADTVQVHPYATAHATASRTDICAGDSIVFTADTFSKYRYMWSPMQYFRSYQGGNTSSVAIGDVLATGNIYLTVRDQYNCIGRDSIMINTQPCCDVFLPNAFTPNGDGRNDVFRIVTVGHHPVKVFEVTNRYGEIVFRSNVETEGWDGKVHGVPQDAGTYFYYLNYTCNGKTIEKKGDVILVR